MEIRFAVAGDAEKLAMFGSETFWDTYRGSDKLNPRDLRAYMSEAFSVSKITKELNDPQTAFLIGEKNGRMAAYAKIVFQKSNGTVAGDSQTELARIYVERSFRGKGFGIQMLEKCLNEAVKAKSDVLWLGVWRYNERAIGFYEKHGFAITGEIEFNLAGNIQKDFVMAKALG
ncbi:MAG: N-acetyltransferase [Pyrinomonadaceae bacterium]